MHPYTRISTRYLRPLSSAAGMPQGGSRYGGNLVLPFEVANWLVGGADGTHIATFSAGTLRYQSDTTSPQLTVDRLGAMVVGRSYQAVLTTSAFTSGSLKTDSFGGNTLLASALGTVAVRGIASVTSFQMTRNSINVDLTMNFISVRRRMN